MARIEKDSMGEMKVDDEALYGASTQRAVLNFPISGSRMPQGFIRGLATVKWACAGANQELGLLSKDKADLIQGVAKEIIDGKLADQFPVDVFQTGSGTSTNMNMNEVLANRVSQIKGEPLGSKRPVHPNDDCNLGQSSNDTIPTSLHVSVALALKEDLKPAVETLFTALDAKAQSFDEIVKIGRTHLMDATPLTLGQEFSGYAAQTKKALGRIDKAISALQELAIGGTAVGTGINTHPEFSSRVVALLSKECGMEFKEATNHFEAQGARDDVVEVAGLLAVMAGSFAKIASDIRLMGSGPRSGLGELLLPSTQPGSSIMPGKVNPVMCEMLIQVCHYIQGMSLVVQNCGKDGQFELNVTMPLMAKCLHDSIAHLANAVRTFSERCIDGLDANLEQCATHVERSLMLVTALNPHIGYDQAARVAKKALAEDKTLKAVVLELGLMEEAELDAALDPKKMTQPSGT